MQYMLLKKAGRWVRWLGAGGSMVGCVLPLALLQGCATEKVNNDLPIQCVDNPLGAVCTGRVRGFYYDYPSDTCRPFLYGPCHGPVQFKSRELCEETCVAGTR